MRLDALPGQVRMAVRSGQRNLPGRRRLVGGGGLFGFQLGLGFGLDLADMTLEGVLFPWCKWPVSLYLPVLGQTRGPITEGAAKSVREHRAPSGLVALGLADTGESIHLARNDLVRRFQSDGLHRVAELSEGVHVAPRRRWVTHGCPASRANFSASSRTQRRSHRAMREEIFFGDGYFPAAIPAHHDDRLIGNMPVAP